ncbi:hypothetical protein HDU76_006093 [Blyttiomyces sp. JEL0837]|nr:hypothetical protein HDU76_006093 [Blyttiomyces sp. JEL0837]
MLVRTLEDKDDKRNIIVTMVLALLSATLSFSSLGINWIGSGPDIEFMTSSTLGFGSGLCIFSGVLYIVGSAIGGLILWRVVDFEKKTISGSDDEGPVYVVLPGQRPIGSMSLSSGPTTRFSTTPQKQKYPPNVVSLKHTDS